MIWKIVLVIVVLVFIVATFQNGFDGIKANPTDSAVQSTKTILDFGKDSVIKGKELIQGNVESNFSNFGRPLCDESSDCNTLLECSGNLCICSGGECVK